MKTKKWDSHVLLPGQAVDAQEITATKKSGIVDLVSADQSMVWTNLERGAKRNLVDPDAYSLWRLESACAQ